jgi:hypothetical protein
MYLYHVLFATMNIYGIDCQKRLDFVQLVKISGISFMSKIENINSQFILS